SLESNFNGSTDITRELAAGIYYVKISAHDVVATIVPYLLELSYTGPDRHGEYPTTATPIEPNSTTTGTVNDNTDTDYFKITTTSRGRLTLTYTGSTNIHLKLLNDHMALVRNAEGTGYADDTGRDITIQTGVIEAGIYYVPVKSGNDDDGDSITGPYSITSSFTPESSQ
ncbi:MAG: pre-peptidase C-terminal domain-containing protein, partial [Sulfurovum sp.]|nr:pre-peptidase C-terminal domain-containing protein [Sulfurovum sp.]